MLSKSETMGAYGLTVAEGQIPPLVVVVFH